MKQKIINISKSILMLGFVFIFSGCDLELQDNYDFKPEFDPLLTFEDKTAWEWMQTRKTVPFTDDEGNLVTIQNEEFDYMIAAVKAAGFESEYSTSGKNRTFLMLNNDAFLGGNDIIQLVTGSSSIRDDNGTPDDPDDDFTKTPDQVFESADIPLLKNVLRYHIITSYVDQIEALPEFNVDYKFQTLLPGSDGEISIRRDERYRLRINRSSDFPSTRADENVRRHNYRYENGIGHIIADYVRKVPFK